jgi:hypothetical protein
MFDRFEISGLRLMLPAALLAGGIFISAAVAQSTAPANTTPATVAPARSLQNRLPRRASQYYGAAWGVDSFSVKWVESGQIIRFSYRVLDARKAAVLNDKKADPFLIDSKAGVKLVVPTLEKIGQLRQTATPEEGKSYWMGFSNKGRPVKRGDRVSVEIGSFRVDGLVVE